MMGVRVAVTTDARIATTMIVVTTVVAHGRQLGATDRVLARDAIGRQVAVAQVGTAQGLMGDIHDATALGHTSASGGSLVEAVLLSSLLGGGAAPAARPQRLADVLAYARGDPDVLRRGLPRVEELPPAPGTEQGHQLRLPAPPTSAYAPSPAPPSGPRRSQTGSASGLTLAEESEIRQDPRYNPDFSMAANKKHFKKKDDQIRRKRQGEEKVQAEKLAVEKAAEKEAATEARRSRKWTAFQEKKAVQKAARKEKKQKTRMGRKKEEEKKVEEEEEEEEDDIVMEDGGALVRAVPRVEDHSVAEIADFLRGMGFQPNPAERIRPQPRPQRPLPFPQTSLPVQPAAVYQQFNYGLGAQDAPAAPTAPGWPMVNPGQTNQGPAWGTANPGQTNPGLLSSFPGPSDVVLRSNPGFGFQSSPRVTEAMDEDDEDKKDKK
ncbi:MAG: hypothetical protein Q9180_001998 [Flavoplaca navasiana]